MTVSGRTRTTDRPKRPTALPPPDRLHEDDDATEEAPEESLPSSELLAPSSELRAPSHPGPQAARRWEEGRRWAVGGPA
jgi:hypothetical protein